MIDYTKIRLDCGCDVELDVDYYCCRCDGPCCGPPSYVYGGRITAPCDTHS